MTLDECECRRRDRRIPRIALGKYNDSPFEYLYNSLNDQALLNATGCDHCAFTILLRKFQVYYHYYTFHSNKDIIRRKKCYMDGTPKGRKRDMSAVGFLRLVLMWYRSTGACTRSLSMHFGQTSTPMYRWIKFGRRILLKSLIDDPNTKVELPSQDKIELYCEANISCK